MLGCLGAVAAVAVSRATSERPDDRHRLGPLVREWELEASAAFLDGYRGAIQGCSVWPADPAHAQRLIDFHCIKHSLCELHARLRTQSEDLSAPLHSLVRRLEHPGGKP